MGHTELVFPKRAPRVSDPPPFLPSPSSICFRTASSIQIPDASFAFTESYELRWQQAWRGNTMIASGTKKTPIASAGFRIADFTCLETSFSSGSYGRFLPSRSNYFPQTHSHASPVATAGRYSREMRLMRPESDCCWWFGNMWRSGEGDGGVWLSWRSFWEDQLCMLHTMCLTLLSARQ